jgi:anionic cell wall polymer biosynthesis LytR-Cps2A-Psr (LCP) family protein
LVYYIAGNLFYRDESGKVIVSIEPGNQRLTGAKTGELLRYDRWPGGRAEQIRTQENVFVELINHKLTADTLKTGETLFKVCVSLIDTDVSLADYMRYSEWLSNLAAKENPAVAVSAGGSFSARDGQSVYKRRL